MRVLLFPLYLQLALTASLKVIWALLEMFFEFYFQHNSPTFERAGGFSIHALTQMLKSFLVLHAMDIFILTHGFIDLAPTLLVLASESLLG